MPGGVLFVVLSQGDTRLIQSLHGPPASNTDRPQRRHKHHQRYNRQACCCPIKKGLVLYAEEVRYNKRRVSAAAV